MIGQHKVSVKQCFDETVKKLSSQPINFVQPVPNLPNNASTHNQPQAKPPEAQKDIRATLKY